MCSSDLSKNGVSTKLALSFSLAAIKSFRAVNGKTEIDFKTKDGIGDAVIQSKNSSVGFNNEFSYTGNVTTDLFIDGEKGVTFNSASGPSTIDYTQGTDPSAHIGIQSNAGTIAFKNKAFTFKSKSTGETQTTDRKSA